MGIIVGGPTPEDGASAYEIAVANGFIGTEAQWLLSLKGAKGDKGDPGATGPAGATGAAGASVTVTPVSFNYGAGTSPYTVSGCVGEYVKIGRLVHCFGSITLNAANGSFLLPFPVKYGFGYYLFKDLGVGSGSPTLCVGANGSAVMTYHGSSYGAPKHFSFTYLTP